MYGKSGIDIERKEHIDVFQKKIPVVIADRNIRGLAWETVTQINERSKLIPLFYEIPEGFHNLVESIRVTIDSSIAGLNDNNFVYYFIRSKDEEKRVGLRLDRTVDLVMKKNSKILTLKAEGDTPFISTHT